jgi:hypothetical protein
VTDDTIEVGLTLTRDKPNSMNFADTYSGLNGIWYKFETDAEGNVNPFATSDDYKQLARSLRMARTGKRNGYHAHHTLEFGGLPERRELTITFCDQKR